MRDGVHMVRCPDGTVRPFGGGSFSRAHGIGDSFAVILLDPESKLSEPDGETG